MKACLVVHGLTGTPATVLSVTEKLTSHGFHVVTPTLAGHTSLETLSHTTWQEWYLSVAEAYHLLRRQTDQIFFAGISLGTLLGLKLASDVGQKLRALALLSTPLQLSFWNSLLVKLVHGTPLHFFISSVAKNFEESVADPHGRMLYREHSLPRLPSHAVLELTKLQRDLLPRLFHIHIPLLLVHALQDKVAPYANVSFIKKHYGSDRIETITLPHSKHVITLDVEKEKVAEGVLQFFQKVIASPTEK